MRCEREIASHKHNFSLLTRIYQVIKNLWFIKPQNLKEFKEKKKMLVLVANHPLVRQEMLSTTDLSMLASSPVSMLSISSFVSQNKQKCRRTFKFLSKQ